MAFFSHWGDFRFVKKIRRDFVGHWRWQQRRFSSFLQLLLPCAHKCVSVFFDGYGFLVLSSFKFVSLGREFDLKFYNFWGFRSWIVFSFVFFFAMFNLACVLDSIYVCAHAWLCESTSNFGLNQKLCRWLSDSIHPSVCLSVHSLLVEIMTAFFSFHVTFSRVKYLFLGFWLFKFC